MSLEVRTFSREDRTFSVDTLLDEFLPRIKIAESFGAIDMDLFMFPDDIGVMVMLEDLLQRVKWPFQVSEFAELLLSEKRRAIIAAATRGEIPEIPPEIAERIQHLAYDLFCLYQARQAIMDKGSTNAEELLSGEYILNKYRTLIEFAYKMIEFDALTSSLDPFMSSKFSLPFLMRFRFLAKTTIHDVRRMTRSAMEITENLADSTIALGTFPENNVTTLPYNRDDRELLSMNPKVYNRVVRSNRPIRELVMNLFKQRELPMLVITTNLQEIAKTALVCSAFSTLREGNRSGVVHGSILEGPTRSLGSEVSGGVLYGPTKMTKASELQVVRHESLMIFGGDSVENDVPPGVLALENGGLFLFATREGETAEQAMERIERRVSEILQQHQLLHEGQSIRDNEKIAPRFLIVETEAEANSHNIFRE